MMSFEVAAVLSGSGMSILDQNYSGQNSLLQQAKTQQQLQHQTPHAPTMQLSGTIQPSSLSQGLQSNSNLTQASLHQSGVQSSLQSSYQQHGISSSNITQNNIQQNLHSNIQSSLTPQTSLQQSTLQSTGISNLQQATSQQQSSLMQQNSLHSQTNLQNQGYSQTSQQPSTISQILEKSDLQRQAIQKNMMITQSQSILNQQPQSLHQQQQQQQPQRGQLRSQKSLDGSPFKDSTSSISVRSRGMSFANILTKILYFVCLLKNDTFAFRQHLLCYSE